VIHIKIEIFLIVLIFFMINFSCIWIKMMSYIFLSVLLMNNFEIVIIFFSVHLISIFCYFYNFTYILKKTCIILVVTCVIALLVSVFVLIWIDTVVSLIILFGLLVSFRNLFFHSVKCAFMRIHLIITFLVFGLIIWEKSVVLFKITLIKNWVFT
jgi:hypothetical protein